MSDSRYTRRTVIKTGAAGAVLGGLAAGPAEAARRHSRRIKKHRHRLLNQASADKHALPLSAGQLVHRAREQIRKRETTEPSRAAAEHLSARDE